MRNWSSGIGLVLGVCLWALPVCAQEGAAGSSEQGVVRVRSQRTVAETVAALQGAIGERGLQLFATIDHAENARGAELSLPDTVLLIFGNPRVGTPLMQVSRTVALDLPQKLLVWSDVEDQVWIAYNDPTYLGRRHGLPDSGPALERISGLLATLAREAGAP